MNRRSKIGLVFSLGTILVGMAAAQALCQAISQPVKGSVKVPTEIVKITAEGANPQAISRGTGPFFLYISAEQTGADRLDLTIVSAAQLPDANKLADIVDSRALAEKGRSAGLVDLPPGEYYLQSASTHERLCTITIKAGL